MSYHQANPRYLEERMKKLKINDLGRVLVLCLTEGEEENGKVHGVQMGCIQMGVNLVVCF
jgi:hypothetical protein